MLVAQAQTPPTALPPIDDGGPAPNISPNAAPVDDTNSSTTESTASGIWICKVEALSEAGMPTGPLAQPLTVGEKFGLTCEGATVPLDVNKMTLQLPKQEKYSLRLLKVQSLDENKGVFTATSYRVGEGPVTGAILSDGARSVELSGIEFNLVTSIDPQVNPESKPYAPMEPLTILWPLWLWATVAGVGLLVCAVLVSVFRRRSQRKALLAELTRHGTALTPYHQFNKDLRLLAREFPVHKPTDWTSEVAGRFAQELNRHFRWYLAREFTVPAFQWSDTLILKEIKKHDKQLHREIRQELRLALDELSKGINVRDKLSAVDGQQLVEICRKLADNVDRVRRAAKTPGRMTSGGRT